MVAVSETLMKELSCLVTNSVMVAESVTLTNSSGIRTVVDSVIVIESETDMFKSVLSSTSTSGMANGLFIKGDLAEWKDMAHYLACPGANMFGLSLSPKGDLLAAIEVSENVAITPLTIPFPATL